MAQGTPQTWNATYETLPDGTDSPDGGDDAFRNLKATVRNALNHEHKVDTTTYSAPAEVGWHRLGSAVIYYGSSEPTNRPDGNTALDSNDIGRIWFKSDTKEFWLWDGSAWTQDFNLELTGLVVQGMLNCSVGRFRVPGRTSDPASPQVGEMWLRTDL